MSPTGISHVMAFSVIVNVALAQGEATSCLQQPDEPPLNLLQANRQYLLKANKSAPMVEGVNQLKAKDFREGTLRIRRPGRYELVEDVVFQPAYDPAKLSWSLYPDDSKKYPLLGGYFLGFFAAISIEAENVQLDCGGHEIKMSKYYHTVQRFFSIIELCSAPFKQGEGPPQFVSNLDNAPPVKCAVNVAISNCRLGLSSHHSIHGNDNAGVTLNNLRMYDFEVAGVALNGASEVFMKTLRIGPSLAKTYPAPLTSSLYMDHIVSTLFPQDPVMNKLLREGKVTIRGRTQKVSSIFQRLRRELQEYIWKRKGPLVPLFGNGDQLPDGSAVYGLLLHRSGVAVRDFGYCPGDTNKAQQLVQDVHVEDVEISDLRVRVDQVIKTFVNDRAALGMSGDVFQLVLAWDPKDNYKYLGNTFTDAQVAAGKLRVTAREMGIQPNKTRFYFGSSHMPKPILDWAASGTPWSDYRTPVLTCNTDAMQHVNKGAVGMRLGFQKDIKVKDVVIMDLYNRGFPNAAPYCSQERYQGADVRGVSLAHMRNLRVFDVKQKGAFKSTDIHRVFPITGISTLQMLADDADTSAES